MPCQNGPHNDHYYGIIMCYPRICIIKTVITAFALTLAASPLAALTVTASNPALISIVDSGETISDITVAGVAGSVTSLALTLAGLSHTYPDDLVLGVVNSSTGLGFVFLSGVGGSTDVNAATLTFSDAAATQLPQSFGSGGGIVSGTYMPSNFGGYQFASFNNATSFADFNGTSANGLWRLYVNDISAGDTGTVADGWSLNFTTIDGAVGGIPEPMTWSLMIVGFGFIGASLRRRRNSMVTVLD